MDTVLRERRGVIIYATLNAALKTVCSEMPSKQKCSIDEEKQ